MKKAKSISSKGRECDDTSEGLQEEAYCGWSQEKEGQELEMLLKGWVQLKN